MPDPAFRHVVNIIESPSPSDILENRREGYSLVSALQLAAIPVRYFAVSNFETLRLAVEDVSRAPASMSRLTPSGLRTEELYIPHIHISAHGNEDGIALTDGTLVEWDVLADVLDRLNVVKGYIGNEKKRGMTALAMSCCRGIHAKAMLTEEKPWPVLAIIGSEEDIPWSDALTGWITYYHLFITKDYDSAESLKRMNIAAGGEDSMFQVYK